MDGVWLPDRDITLYNWNGHRKWRNEKDQQRFNIHGRWVQEIKTSNSKFAYFTVLLAYHVKGLLNIHALCAYIVYDFHQALVYRSLMNLSSGADTTEMQATDSCSLLVSHWSYRTGTRDVILVMR